MKYHIQKQWESYEREVMHPKSPEIQRLECRRAFFAGARAFQSIVFGGLSQGKEPTIEDMAFMVEIDAELNDFKERVKRGLA